MLKISATSLASLAIELLCRRTVDFLATQFSDFHKLDTESQYAFVEYAFQEFDALDFVSERSLFSIAAGKWTLGLVRLDDAPSLFTILKHEKKDEEERTADFLSEISLLVNQRRLA